MNKGNNKKLKLSIFEIVWYTLCGLVAIWGITYIILGLLGDALPGTDNAIAEASNGYAKTFGLGFLGYGLIHVAVAAIASIIVLLLQSKKSDRDIEKAQRRAAIRASARQLSQEDEAVDLTQNNELPNEPVKEETTEHEIQVQVEEEKKEEPQE